MLMTMKKIGLILLAIWMREPVLIIGVIAAGSACGVAFGLKITPDAQAKLIAFIGSVALLAMRASVTSPATLAAAKSDAADGATK